MSYETTVKGDIDCPDGEPTISGVYTQCHLKFQELVDIIHDDRYEELKQFDDEFAKLKLWAGNLGAAHSGKSYEISLDYRLKQALFYKAQVSVLEFFDHSLVLCFYGRTKSLDLVSFALDTLSSLRPSHS